VNHSTEPPHICEWDGCSEPAIIYWQRKRSYLLKDRPKQMGHCPLHHAMTRDLTMEHVCRRRIEAKSGYVAIKVAGKWMAEHRRVMECLIGRKLVSGETVLLKEGVDRLNNAY
jgi:hypothetical protein